MELVPQPLGHLLRRMRRELDERDSLFDLPRAKWWGGAPAGLDLSRRFHGARVASVVGPAAGPHTQLAPNLILSYLAGGRVMELKTVQINDRLVIPRPCIDAETVGYNVEWSQELRVPDSAAEYAKAALLLAALDRLGVGPRGLDADHLFDLSLGYDLAGVQSEVITGFVRSMLDASALYERLLGELPAELGELRGLAPSPRLVRSVTLSTFHGCPANEIEGIARHLMEAFGLHVVVKLNPTLLGFEAVDALVRGHLGYSELVLHRAAFEKDLQLDDALAMIGRLRAVAHQKGVSFGVKLTNTLVVGNHKTFFSEKEMYLSGQPLHVLALQLHEKLRGAIPLVGPAGEPPIAYSFSAGIDQKNFPSAASAELLPITVCTDLLRPGGYGRLPKYLERLGEAMRGAGVVDVPSYVLRAHGQAEAAMGDVIDALGPSAEAEALRRAAAAIGELTGDPAGHLARHGVRDPERLAALWVSAAGAKNATPVAKAALDDPRYRRAENAKGPKKIGRRLQLFDCTNCDKCVPVCPNDANFVYTTEVVSLAVPTLARVGDALVAGPDVRLEVGDTHQLATFVDACNACGNCDVFCPEDGGPYVIKPHWFGSRASFDAERLDGYVLESRSKIVGRIGGALRTLEVRGDTLRFTTTDAELELSLSGDRLTLARGRALGPRAAEVDVREAAIMATLLAGVLRTVNPVSAGLPATG